ncbi:DUF4158 domain-containing protein [Streptomyces sp. MBT42]|nr:DUF4158 domain-containing protein [Streptomyces sp. MBT42]
MVKRYTGRRQTLYDHAWEIRDAYGYHPYEDVESGRRFRTFLHGRAWTHAESPKALFDHAVGWLRRHRVPPPGVSDRGDAAPGGEGDRRDSGPVPGPDGHTRLLNTAKRKTEEERLSTLPQLEKASRVPARAAKVLFEELELVEEQEADLDVAALWAAVEEVAPRAAVMSAATVVTLVPEDENSAEVAMRAALANRYATVRPFLALLGGSKALDAASAGKRVLAGVRALPAPARREVGVKPLLSREVDDKLVPPAWRKAVYANPDLPQGAVYRDAYVVCVLEQLHRTLDNHDVFAAPSHCWSNPRARLLDRPDRDAVEEDVLAALSLDMPLTRFSWRRGAGTGGVSASTRSHKADVIDRRVFE